MNALAKFRSLAKIVELSPWLFVISVLLTGVATVSELISLSVLVPLLNLISSANGHPFKLPLIGQVTPRPGTWEQNLNMVFLLLLVSLSCAAFTSLCLALSGVSLGRFTVNWQSLVRKSIYERYMSFGKAFFDRTDANLLLSVALDCTSETATLLFALRPVVANILLGGALVVFLFLLSWRLTLLVVAVIPLLYLPLNWMGKKIKNSSTRGLSSNMVLRSYTQDALSNISLIQAYSNEGEERRRFSKRVDDAALHAFNVYKKLSTLLACSDLMAMVGLTAIVAVGLRYFLTPGGFSIGLFVMYFYGLRRCVAHWKFVGEGRSVLARMSPILDKIFWVYGDADKTYVEDGTEIFTHLQQGIEFRDVRFEYQRDHAVLRGVNMTIQKGTTVALIGKTGSGKSTLAHLLCRFYDPGGGSIQLDGQDIRRYQLESLRHRIAIVSQDTLLFNDTLRHNVTFGLRREVSQQELDTVARQARLYDMIARLPSGWETVVGARGLRLSGGERQRLSIARALLKNPDVLILDEATSALDTETEMLIQEAIEELMQDRTVLAIAHRYSTIQRANWIIALHEGKIIGQSNDLSRLLNEDGHLMVDALSAH